MDFFFNFVFKNISTFQLAEMVRIVGYHIPSSCDKHHHFLKKKFGLSDRIVVTKRHTKLQENGTMATVTTQTKLSGFQPLTYEPRMYSRSCIEEDDSKREKFSDKDTARESYLDTILTDLSPSDVRLLIKSEEERIQCSGFHRYKVLCFFI